MKHLGDFSISGTLDAAGNYSTTTSSPPNLTIDASGAIKRSTAFPISIPYGGTGATDAATARANLGLGTAALFDVPVSGDATASQVVKGNDSRLSGGSTPGSNSQVIYNWGGVLKGSANMTFNGTQFVVQQASARMMSVTLNSNTTLSASHVNRIVKKTAGGNLTYTIPSSLGADDDTITFFNASTSGAMYIARSGVSLYVNNVSVTNRVVQPRSFFTIMRMSATVWVG